MSGRYARMYCAIASALAMKRKLKASPRKISSRLSSTVSKYHNQLYEILLFNPDVPFPVYAFCARHDGSMDYLSVEIHIMECFLQRSTRGLSPGHYPIVF